jgi:hypothetical protein
VSERDFAFQTFKEDSTARITKGLPLALAVFEILWARDLLESASFIVAENTVIYGRYARRPSGRVADSGL